MVQNGRRRNYSPGNSHYNLRRQVTPSKVRFRLWTRAAAYLTWAEGEHSWACPESAWSLQSGPGNRLSWLHLPWIYRPSKGSVLAPLVNPVRIFLGADFESRRLLPLSNIRNRQRAIFGAYFGAFLSVARDYNLRNERLVLAPLQGFLSENPPGAAQMLWNFILLKFLQHS
jgi:hypothetical protein